MAKIINYWDNARKEVTAGIQKVADAVKVTMGSKGKNVILERSYGAPTITNDGVTVAKEIELEDKMENIGAELVKEAASKTNDSAGDGTTTTVVLVDAIVNEWLRYINSGVNPFSLNTGLHKAIDHVVNDLSQKAKQISDKEEIKQIATISAQNEEVGELISEVMEEVGKDGVVTVEEGKSIGLEKDVVKGMQFDQGYASPYFVSDSQRMEATVEKPYILITDKKISNLKEIQSLMESVVNSGKKDMVIVAEDIDGEALATLVLNKLRGIINVSAVKAPGFGDRKKEMLQDIAKVTGGQVISEDLGLKLENATLDMLGQADKVVSTQNDTTVVGGNGDQADIEQRAQEVRSQIENTSSDYDREKLQERLARLVGGVAVIRVGAATEMEMKNKKYKIEDALNATRAAIEEGIIAGGGVSLLKLAAWLESLQLDDKDQQVGVEIVKESIQYPAKQILNNAGYKGELIVEKIKENEWFSYWFNAKTGQYADLLQDGVIDPVKVIRVALQESVSSAGMLLTTDAVVADKPSEKGEWWDEAPAWGGVWWMWGMWGMPGMM